MQSTEAFAVAWLISTDCVRSFIGRLQANAWPQHLLEPSANLDYACMVAPARTITVLAHTLIDMTTDSSAYSAGTTATHRLEPFMRTCTSLLLGAALSLHLTPVAAADGVDSAETYAETCAQCHGRTGRGMASFPRIAGKSEAFVAERLLQYRAGETVGPNSSLMIAAVAHLTDEDIAGLAAYIDENFK